MWLALSHHASLQIGRYLWCGWIANKRRPLVCAVSEYFLGTSREQAGAAVLIFSFGKVFL